MNKKKTFIMVCILELALVAGTAFLFPDLAAAHPVAFILSAALAVVSSVTVALLIYYYNEQHTILKAKYELEKNEIQEEVNFALRGIGGGILIARDDEDKTFVYVSESLAALFGYTVEEFLEASGNKSSGIVFAEDFPAFKEKLLDESNTLRFRVRCKDGSVKWVSSRGKIVIGDNGERLRYSFNHDITQLMEINRKADELTNLLKQERQLYRDALLHDCDYAYIVNVDENRFEDVYKGEFLSKYLFDATLPYDEVMARVFARMSPVILFDQQPIYLTSHYIDAYAQGKRVVEVEHYIPDADSYKRKTVFLSRNEAGTLYAVSVANDITDRRKEDLDRQVALSQLVEAAKKVGTGDWEVRFNTDVDGEVGVLADVLNQTVLQLRWHTEMLQKQAIQDPLTKVKNKRAWQEAEKRLDEAIREGKADFAVVVCDINGLKQVNDTLGHEAGDDLIIRASKHICDVFKRSPVYRIGGDEFTAVLEGGDLLNHEDLIRAFHAGMENQPQDKLPVSVALGLARYMQDDASFSDVFHRADEAMYRNKDAMKAHKTW